MLRNMARSFLTDKCKPAVVRECEKDPRGYSPELWKEIAGLGWTGLVLPEQYGGGGMGFLDLAILLEESGRACLPAPFFSTVVLGGMPILDLGTAEQKQAYLPRIASGEAIMSLALTESDGLLQARSIQTRAVKDGTDYVLGGSKLFVPDAHIADFLLCVARTGQGTAEDGVSLFIVDARSPGVTCKPLKSMAGVLSQVVFDGVRVPQGNVLGQIDGVWIEVCKIIDVAALALCCEMVGGLAQVVDMTVNYAKERKQFDQPIGVLQIIQHYCARMVTDLEAARFGTYHAAWRLSSGLPCSRILGLAHEIHGAIGTTLDHALQLYTPRLTAGQTSFGDADYHRESAAQLMPA